MSWPLLPRLHVPLPPRYTAILESRTAQPIVLEQLPSIWRLHRERLKWLGLDDLYP